MSTGCYGIKVEYFWSWAVPPPYFLFQSVNETIFIISLLNFVKAYHLCSLFFTFYINRKLKISLNVNSASSEPSVSSL